MSCKILSLELVGIYCWNEVEGGRKCRGRVIVYLFVYYMLGFVLDNWNIVEKIRSIGFGGYSLGKTVEKLR